MVGPWAQARAGPSSPGDLPPGRLLLPTNQLAGKRAADPQAFAPKIWCSSCSPRPWTRLLTGCRVPSPSARLAPLCTLHPSAHTAPLCAWLICAHWARLLSVSREPGPPLWTLCLSAHNTPLCAKYTPVCTIRPSMHTGPLCVFGPCAHLAELPTGCRVSGPSVHSPSAPGL